MNYKEIKEDILELAKSCIIIEGIADIKDNSFVNLNEDSFWSVLGYHNHDSILDSLLEYDINEVDGEYHFTAILKWIKEDYGCGWYEIANIDFYLQQTLIERDREEKLDILFDFF
jgi:hypothetical protein